MTRPDGDNQTQVLERNDVKTPRLFRVLLLNDDYTTMQFVVMILIKYFRKSLNEARAITLAVHHQGQGVAGIYSRDIAQTKASQVIKDARKKGFPLMAIAEPAE